MVLLLDNISSFQTIMTLSVWFVIKVPASVLSHGLLKPRAPCKFRKARYEECSLIRLQFNYLISSGKYPAKIHIVQLTIHPLFVSTCLGKTNAFLLYQIQNTPTFFKKCLLLRVLKESSLCK